MFLLGTLTSHYTANASLLLLLALPSEAFWLVPVHAGITVVTQHAAERGREREKEKERETDQKQSFEKQRGEGVLVSTRGA